MFDPKVLAANIKKYRQQNGIKQYTLAQQLLVTPQSVSKWEQGSSVPDLENICRLSEILGVSIDTLLSPAEAAEKLMIAVDGGGTATAFMLFTDQGILRQQLVLSGSNPNIYGIEKTFEILKTGIDSLYPRSQALAGIYCGLSGYTAGDNAPRISEFLQRTYPKTAIKCAGDIFNVAASADAADKCITVICGTGSNVSAIDGDTCRRVGGWGYLFSGKGSGFDIGRDAVAAALAENDGFGQHTLLTQLVEQKLGANIWDSIPRLYAEERSFIAAFSREVFDAYRQADAVAEEILRSNMACLAEQINFAAKTYDCGNTVILSGGIINPVSVGFLQEYLTPGLQTVVPEMPQMYGACILGGKAYCRVTDSFREKLKLAFRNTRKERTENAEN